MGRAGALAVVCLILVGCGGDDDSSGGADGGPGDGDGGQLDGGGEPSCPSADLTGSDGEAGDGFGSAISMSGDRALVGAPVVGAGVAYVYARTGCEWSEEATLDAEGSYYGGAEGDEFGRSVAIAGDVAVVGAPGVNQLRAVNTTIETLYDAGAAFIFDRQPDGTWIRTQLTQINGEGGDRFGDAVAAAGTIVAVGYPYREVISTDAGQVNVYDKQEGGWAHVAVLRPDLDYGGGSHFGSAVAVDGDTIVVGAPHDDQGGTSAGAAYVFERQEDGEWLKVQKLRAWDPVASAMFATSVAVSGDSILIGAPGDDDGGSAAGAVYAYQRHAAGRWLDTAKLVASDGEADDSLGRSVALDGDRAAAGAHHDSLAPIGFVLLFERSDAGVWSEIDRLEAPADHELGGSVAVSGTSFLAGAAAADSEASPGMARVAPFVGDYAIASPPSCAAPAGASLRIVGVSDPATGQVTVNLEGSGPVVLILSSYSAATWQVRSFGDIDVARIIINGYEDQMVTGDGAASAEEHSYEGTGSSYVDVYPYQYPSESATTLITQAETDTELTLASFHADYQAGDFTVRNCAP